MNECNLRASSSNKSVELAAFVSVSPLSFLLVCFSLTRIFLLHLQKQKLPQSRLSAFLRLPARRAHHVQHQEKVRVSVLNFSSSFSTNKVTLEERRKYVAWRGSSFCCCCLRRICRVSCRTYSNIRNVSTHSDSSSLFRFLLFCLPHPA
uniref:Transmembrane protein n=1 Tax=Grammatophora oceanica TaxID=210454 RepID=A0A7S1YHG0_9STRA